MAIPTWVAMTGTSVSSIGLPMNLRRNRALTCARTARPSSACAKPPKRPRIELSSMMETEIICPIITADANGPKHLVLKLTRAKFEQMTDDLLARCRHPFENALKDANLESLRFE